MKIIVIVIVLVFSCNVFASEKDYPIVDSKTFYNFCGSALQSFDAARAAGGGNYDSRSMAMCMTYTLAYLSGYNEGVFSSAEKMADKEKNWENSYKKYSLEFQQICVSGNGDPMNLIRPIMNYFNTHENSLNEPLYKAVREGLKEVFPCAE